MNSELQQRLEALSQLVSGELQEDAQAGFWAKFGLSGNPFPPSGIADASEENPPLRDDVTKSILRFIIQSYKSRSTQSLILRGDYGTGKTHTLRFIEHTVNSLMGLGDQTARAIYVERPRIEAHELNRTILKSLGLDTVRKYIWFAIKGQIAQEIANDSERFQELKTSLTTPKRPLKSAVPPPMLIQDVPQTMSASLSQVFDVTKLEDHRHFLLRFDSAKWNRELLRPFIIQCLLTVVGENFSSELAGIFVALLLSRDESTFTSWENLTGLIRSKATASLRAPEFLDFLVKILNINGIAYLYLLLDEFEEVPQGFLLTPRQRQDYLYTMREVFDRIREGVAIVMAITPSAFDVLNELATPFADRQSNIVDLDAISVQDAVRLAEFFLSRKREGEALESNIYPLSEELLEYTIENFPTNAQRTPRSLIQFLYQLFEHAENENVAEIGELVVKDVLDQFSASKITQRKNQSSGRRNAF
ncbi:hypothetical protein EON83_11115 [bacterium]|nr:MAG: hypothetical protein EON83_11115 [bacterium]